MEVFDSDIYRFEIFKGFYIKLRASREGDADAVSPSSPTREGNLSYEAIEDPFEALVEENTNELEFLFAAEILLGETYSTREVAALNIYGEKGGGRLKIKKDPLPQDIEMIDSFRKIQVHRETKKAWQAMVSAGRAAGHKHPLLMPTSGYRSTARQAELWQQALKKYGSETEARKWIAKPGGSAHHSGRALDLYLGTRNNKESVEIQRSLPVYQ